MRFNPDYLKTSADHHVWRTWFAWVPVKLTGGEWCWLEWIQRRGEWVSIKHIGGSIELWRWEYRDVPSVTKPRAGKVERGGAPRPER